MESIIIAFIGAAQAVIIALLARQGQRTRKAANKVENLSNKVEAVQRDAAAAREQVENSHVEQNLRDDLDEKHSTITGLIRTVIQKSDEHSSILKEHNGAIVGMRKDLRQLRDTDHALRQDISAQGDEVRRMDQKMDEHIDWSRDYVSEQERKNRAKHDS